MRDLAAKYHDEKRLLEVEILRRDILSLIDWRDDLGNSHLHLTVSDINGLERVSSLLKFGSDVNAKNKQGDTPLLCSNFTDPRIIEALVKAGADVHVTNNKGQGPLHPAAKSQCLESVKLLLDAGIDVNLVDHADKSPLYYAVAANDTYETVSSAVRFIVERGAELNRPGSVNK